MAGSGLENCLLFINTGKNECTLYLQTQKLIEVCTVLPLQHFLTSFKIAISCWCMLMYAGIHTFVTDLSPLPFSPLRRVCVWAFSEDFVFIHHCKNAVLQMSDTSHKTNYRNLKGLVLGGKGNLTNKVSYLSNAKTLISKAMWSLRGTCRWGCDPKPLFWWLSDPIGPLLLRTVKNACACEDLCHIDKAHGLSV